MSVSLETPDVCMQESIKMVGSGHVNVCALGSFKVPLICYLLVTYSFTYFPTYLIRKTISRENKCGFKNNELD